MIDRNLLLKEITKAIVNRDKPERHNKLKYYEWIYSILVNKTNEELIKLKTQLMDYLDEA